MKRILWLAAAALAVLTWIAAVSAGEPTTSPNSTAYEASHVLKASQGVLYSITTNYHTAAYRTLMVFDSPTVPSNGATTACGATHATGCLAWCWEGDAQSTAPTQSYSWHDFNQHPLALGFGVSVVASTSTSGCSSLTADGSNEWFHAQVN